MAKIYLEKRRKRSQQELKNISRHVMTGMRYLSERLNFFLILGGGKYKEGSEMAIVLDSFLIHARKIVEFLYSNEKTYADDVIAEDFFEDPQLWLDNRPEKTELLKTINKNFGKLIAHFTYKLSDFPNERILWELSETYIHIFEAFQIFIDFVEPGVLLDDFELLRKNNPDIIILCPQYSKGKPTGKLWGMNQGHSSFIIKENNKAL